MTKLARTYIKYLGYTFLLKSDPFNPDRIEKPKKCTDVTIGDDDTIFIGFDNGFAPKEDCFFLAK